MTLPGPLQLESRRDEFSYQVAASADQRFWFRLERDGQMDRVTDFLVGDATAAEAVDLLVACYRQLGLRPAHKLIFADLCSSRAVTPTELAAVREFYSLCGQAALARFGFHDFVTQLTERDEKYDLSIEAGS